MNMIAPRRESDVVIETDPDGQFVHVAVAAATSSGVEVVYWTSIVPPLPGMALTVG
jgi:hypothetical protein